MSDKDFAGKGGFIWWTGVIENRQDPLKLGRCQIRCVGWDADNRMEVPTDALPWAMPLLPPNNTMTYTPNEGDTAFGFFMDGENAQERVLMGIFPKIPLKGANPQDAFGDPREDLSSAPRKVSSKTYNTDGTGIELTEGDAVNYPANLDEPTTSRLARNESIDQTFIQERKDNVVTGVETVNATWDEPETKYDAVYPYNNVMETESGHIVEYDDTPGAERIHIAHRNGSFTEWYPDGDRVEKITKDKYTIIMKDDHLYVMGKCLITVQGDAEVYVKENAYLKVDKNVEMTVGENVTADIGGDVTATVGGNATADIGGNLSATVGGNMTADVSGNSTETIGGSKTINASGSCDIISGGAIKIAGASVAITGTPVSLN